MRIGTVFILLMGGFMISGLLSSCRGFKIDGPPPAGDIVTVTDNPAVYSPAAAVNYMITSLSMACMDNFRSGSTILCQYDFQAGVALFDHYPLRVTGGVGDLVLFRPDSTATVQLSSRISSVVETEGVYVWEMELTRAGRRLWSERVMFAAGI